MSKSKKICSIALAALLALQLLLVPTFAEGETTEDTTVTGKYTTADNLPAIYGAGVSVDDVEEVPSFTDLMKADDTKLYAPYYWEAYYNAKLSLNTDSTYVARGTKSLKVNSTEQGRFYFALDMTNNIDNFLNYNSFAFYVNIPAGNLQSDKAAEDTNCPDNKYGIGIAKAKARGAWDSTFVYLTNLTVTYYFKTGEKLVKTGESGIYPYGVNGELTSSGFDGYVAVSMGKNDLDSTTYKYLRITALGQTYNNSFLQGNIYFDDFRVLNSEYFVPYAYQDFEALDGDTVIQNNWQMPYKVFCKDVAKTDNTSENVSYSVDATGLAQGKNSMKIAINGTRGNFRMAIGLTKTGSPFNTTDYNGVAFYVSIPAGQNSKIEVALYDQYEWGNKKSLNAVYTYWFEDGSVLVKYGDDGIYPYDKSGNKSTNGFNGYISVYYGDCSLTDYPYLQLRGPDWNASLQNKSIYLDDIRPCNFNVVADLVSGDAYYVNDTAIPVQKVGDTATLSVMTNLAKLGMARNADGISALRDVMLGYTTAADKHNVNGDEKTDIRDLVALYTLAAQ